MKTLDTRDRTGPSDMRRGRTGVLWSLTAVAGAALLSACGSIMNGSTQEIGLSSSPTGAQVLVNGQPRGDTPVVADLDRKDQHRIRIELEGYEPYEVALSRSVSGWVWGNLVFGGIPGLAVDAITGGLYKLSPEQVMAELREAGESEVSMEDDRILVTVVLRPDPRWERVGEIPAVESRR